ncbi:MAG TPA: dynamin, partial [Anaerolineae bacterium]|nr:dynamin [Anaerolineae bacterium]
VMEFIRQNALALLGFAPEVFPISARLALRSKLAETRGERSALWAASNFEDVETYIHKTLDEKSRLKLKLHNPMGVGERLAASYLQLVRNRLALLAEDLKAIENIEGQLDIYRSDMQNDFRYRMADVEKVLLTMNNRGMVYFDETLRLARVLDLVNTQRIQGEFERKVVADTPYQIEQEVSALIDWMVARDLRQWQATLDYLDRHRAKLRDQEEKIIGQVGGPFEYNRRELLDSVGRAAKEVVMTYDQETEARKLASGVRDAVAGVALLQVGAVGLGAVLIAILHTALADFTGILAAGALAVVGLLIIPAKRRRAKNDLYNKLEDLRQRLMAAMTEQFEQELSRSLQRLREAIAPYTRFVRAEQQKLSRIEAELAEINATLGQIRVRIEEL